MDSSVGDRQLLGPCRELGVLGVAFNRSKSHHTRSLLYGHAVVVTATPNRRLQVLSHGGPVRGVTADLAQTPEKQERRHIGVRFEKARHLPRRAAASEELGASSRRSLAS